MKWICGIPQLLLIALMLLAFGYSLYQILFWIH